MSDQRNDRRGGFYWILERPYVTVTTALKVIDKPALLRWYGKQVYLAMVKDPSLDELAALNAPYQVSENAKSRGKTVHSIVEAYKSSGAVIDTIPDEFKGYAEAFYSWIKDQDVEILENEKTVVSVKHMYAGTMDMIVKNKKTNETWIIDVKTGKDIYLEAFLQLSAYKAALEEKGQKVDRLGVLLLQETGKYKFEETESYFEAFLAAKSLWEFINKEDCKKLGYTKGGE